MKRYVVNIIIPALILLTCCFLLILFLYNPKENQTINLEKFFVLKRDEKENKVYTNIKMDKFVDEVVKTDDMGIEATLYIYEDLNYKYIEIIPLLNYVSSYYIAYDKINDIGIFSNYRSFENEEIVRYYLYDKTVDRIYNVSKKNNITEKTEEIIKNYKTKEVENCFIYYLYYKVN